MLWDAWEPHIQSLENKNVAASCDGSAGVSLFLHCVRVFAG
jgi:hypothetical protein